MVSLDRLAAAGAARLMPGHARWSRIAGRADRGAGGAPARAGGRDPGSFGRGATDVASVVAAVYRDVPPALHPAAARNVLAHLVDLHGRKVVVAAPLPGRRRGGGLHEGRVAFFFARPWTPVKGIAIGTPVFRRSSAVEQLTVNQLVVGSIPTAGAKNPYKTAT